MGCKAQEIREDAVTEEQLREYLQSKYAEYKAPPKPPEGYYTIEQLSKLMGISLTSIRRWIDDQPDMFDPLETKSRNGRAAFVYKPKLSGQ